MTNDSSAQRDQLSRRPVSTNTERLFWIVVAGVVLYVVLDIIVQLLPPHYNPITQAESDLAVGPYGYIMAINFVNRGLLSLIFLYAFARTFGLDRENGRYKIGIYLLGVWGAGAFTARRISN